MADSTAEAAREAGRLDKNADNLSHPLTPAELRASRWRAREAVQRLTHRPNVSKCGRCRIAPAVELRLSDGRASYGGVASCGAVWLCAVCNAKIAARRALEVGAALQWATETRSPAYFGALTLHHTAADPLDLSLRRLAEAWQLMISGRAWQDICDQAGGQILTVRTLEINIGPNGWHVHFHPVMLMPRAHGRQAEHAAAAALVRWMQSVSAVGGSCKPSAQRLERVITLGDIGTYITAQTYGQKASRLDLEMTNAQGKAGFKRENGTLSHWSIIEDLASQGADNAHSEARYFQLEAYTRKKRQITWSPTLRKLAGLRTISDEDAASAVEGRAVATLTPAGWEQNFSLGLRLPALQALERGGWAAVAELWDRHGIEYTEVPL